jgi:hypothetical protein
MPPRRTINHGSNGQIGTEVQWCTRIGISDAASTMDHFLERRNLGTYTSHFHIRTFIVNYFRMFAGRVPISQMRDTIRLNGGPPQNSSSTEWEQQPQTQQARNG